MVTSEDEEEKKEGATAIIFEGSIPDICFICFYPPPPQLSFGSRWKIGKRFSSVKNYEFYILEMWTG